jgi:hypothetical protein
MSVSSDNVTGGDNQQETDWRTKPNGILRDCTPSTTWINVVKIQSDLHGDMQSQAEMTWPLVALQPSGVTKVPKVASPVRARALPLPGVILEVQLAKCWKTRASGGTRLWSHPI